MSFVSAKTGDGVRRAGPSTRTQAQRLSSKKIQNKATKRIKQNYLISFIGKLQSSPSKKCTWSSVYANKLTGSVSLNDLVYNSREMWCTALLWSPNHTLWPKPFGPVTARVHAWTRLLSSRLNSRRLDEPGCVCVMRQSGAEWCHTWALLHGTHEVTFCGRSLRVQAWRWPPDGWTAKRFMDEWWLRGASLWERSRFGSGASTWGAFPVFTDRAYGLIGEGFCWPALPLLWDEVGWLICPVCASLPKTRMKRGKGESSKRWISRCSHKRDLSHSSLKSCIPRLWYSGKAFRVSPICFDGIKAHWKTNKQIKQKGHISA